MTCAVNDRELLELAAKAVGQIQFDPFRGVFRHVLVMGFLGDDWNPLTDDGDALRLAIELRINITTDGQHPAAVFFHPDRGRYIHLKEDQSEVGMGAAVRRAIVRAAAALAKFTIQEPLGTA